jgi:hypothetical protein
MTRKESVGRLKRKSTLFPYVITIQDLGPEQERTCDWTTENWRRSTDIIIHVGAVMNKFK